jgi:hypothetical protein
MAARPPAEIFAFTFHRQGFHKVSIVTTHTHQTAPTQFVEANGIRFAYRRFGKATGVPLVFNQHYTGTMDHWDPAVTDGFAREREVILFSNAARLSSSISRTLCASRFDVPVRGGRSRVLELRKRPTFRDIGQSGVR